MSCIKTYKCNLCQEVREPKHLLCVYWDSTLQRADKTFGWYRLITDVNGADRHICKDCFAMVATFIEHHKDLIPQ